MIIKDFLIISTMTCIQVVVSASSLLIPATSIIVAGKVDLDPSFVGYFVGLTYLSAMCVSFFIGWLISFLGTNKLNFISLFLPFLALSVFSCHPNTYTLFASAFIIGISYGIVTPVSSAIISKHTEAKYQPLYFSIKQTGVPLGGVTASVLYVFLSEANWFSPFYVNSSILIVAALLLFFVKRFDSTEGSVRNPLSGFLTSIKLPGMLRVSMYSFLMGGAQLVIISFAILFSVNVMDFTYTQSGVALALVHAGGVIGRIFWGFVSSVIFSTYAVLNIIPLLFFGSVSLLYMMEINSIILYLSLFLAVGFFIVGWNGVFLAEVSRIAGKGGVGSSTGVALIFTYCGVLVFPPLTSYLFKIVGSYEFVLAFSAALALLAVIVNYKSKRVFL